MHKEAEENEKLQYTVEQLNATLRSMEQEKSSMVVKIENLSSTCDKLVKGKATN